MASYLDALEKEWRTRRRAEPGQGWTRPRALRGRDFVLELKRLFHLTQDPRFDWAVDALAERGIIDKNLNFTRWQPPAAMKHQEQRYNSVVVSLVTVKMTEERKSLRRACAETAAAAGHPAASFEAAVKDLELRVRGKAGMPA